MAIKMVRKKEETGCVRKKKRVTALLSKEERGRWMIRDKHKGRKTKG